MENKNKFKHNKETSTKKYSLIIFYVFAGAIIIACNLIFIFNYSIAYDNDSGAGWLPPSFAIIYYYFLLSVFSILIALILKAILTSKIKLVFLLIASIILPIICYPINCSAFSKDGILYPLVDKDGLLHFIAIGDFNFDGINDKEYHRRYEERSCSQSYSDDVSTLIRNITTTSVGIGWHLESCFTFYDGEKGTIDLHLYNQELVLKQVKLVIRLADSLSGDQVAIYEVTESEETLVSHNVNEDGSISIIFDEDTCSEWQSNTNGKNFIVHFKCKRVDT